MPAPQLCCPHQTKFVWPALHYLEHHAGSHRIAGRISDSMSDVMGLSCGFDLTRAPLKENHLIIVGYGLNGRNVARAAKYAGIPYRIIDSNPDMVRNECDQGEPIFYGDGTQAAVLELAGIKTARIIVVAIADRISTQQGRLKGRRSGSERGHSRS